MEFRGFSVWVKGLGSLRGLGFMGFWGFGGLGLRGVWGLRSCGEWLRLSSSFFEIAHSWIWGCAARARGCEGSTFGV